MASDPKQRFTLHDYLALERQAETRSEYLDGEMFARSGASATHNVLVTNLVAALHPQLRSRGCDLYANDMRVRTPTDLVTYPDVAVACGPRQFDDRHRDTLLNPTVLFEVLSPSTQDYDRGTKFAHYRTLASLTDFVLVAQDHVHVEHYSRQGRDRWILLEVEGLDRRLELSSIGCELALAEIYEEAFEDQPAS